MANTTLTNLPTVTSLNGTEPLLGVQSSTSVQITTGQIAAYTGSIYGIPTINTGDMLANISGVNALPTGVSLSQFLDYSVTSTQGSVMYRDASGWTAITPGILGQALTTNGPNANVQWRDSPGGGTVVQITAGTNLSATPVNPITASGTISTVMNPAFTTSVTTPNIYGGSSASETLTIQSTTGAGTSDSIKFNVGNLGSTTAMSIDTTGLVTIPNVSIQGGNAILSTATVPLVIGGTAASSSLTLQSTSGVGTTDSILMKVGNNGAVTALSVASSGVVTIGTLNLTNALSVLYGGTGATTLTTNGVLYGNATSAVGVTAAGTTGQVLVATTGSAPSWSSTIPSTAGVTSISFGTTGLTPSTATTGAITVAGTLVAANGGTGQSSYTIGDLLYASGTTALSKLADVAVGSVLVSGGVGTAPAYSSSPSLTTSLTVPIVYGGTGAASSLTLQSTSGAGTTDSIIFKVGNAGAVTALTIGTTGAATFGVSATSPYYIANGTTTGSRNQGAYAYGTLGYSDTNVLLSLQSSVNTYNELVIQNTNSGTTASTSIIVSNDLGTASTYFGEFGMNSSGFTGTGSLSGASNVYLTSTSSDLAIGTTTANAIRFVANSGTTDALLIRSDGNIAIGSSTGSASVNLLTNTNITGGTTAYAHLNNGVVQSGVTSNAGSFVSNMSSAAAAFTTTSAVHFWANPGAGGVGSTITNHYGFLADLTLGTAGAATVTNAYGFYGNIASATNRWNLYMGGTAGNYLAGSLGVGTTTNVGGASPTTWLQIAAGTSTVSPVRLTSGTNLGTAAAGAIEYNGTAVLATPVGSERGIVTSPQYYVNNATRTGPAAAATFVNILPANPSLTASTRYAFEIYFAITKTSANACTGAIGFSVTGTAPAALSYEIYSTTGAAQTTVAAASLMSNYITTGFGTAVVATAASAAAANTYHTVLIKGTVDTGAGAITSFAPQFQYSTGAPTASTFQVGAYMYIYPLSATGAATSVGTWA